MGAGVRCEALGGLPKMLSSDVAGSQLRAALTCFTKWLNVSLRLGREAAAERRGGRADPCAG